MKRPDWIFVLAALASIGVTSEFRYAKGYEDGRAKATAEQQYVRDQMAKAGFCGWVQTNDFVAHCLSTHPAEAGK